jgi:predicted kinase
MVNDRVRQDVERLRRSLGDLPQPQIEPPLIVVSGLPGTGKSFLCRTLAERLDYLVLSSDSLRQTLFLQPKYDDDENRQLFAACHALIEGLLKTGIPIIFDATNLLERHREPLYHICDKAGAKLILVSVEAPEELVQERLLGRESGTDPEDRSRAGWEVHERMKCRKEKIPRNHFVVDTSRDINVAIDKIARATRK